MALEVFEKVKHTTVLILRITCLVLLFGQAAQAGISIKYPVNGATLGGNVTVQAYVDQAWWSKLWVDGKSIATASTGNVTFNWDTTKVSDGDHTLSIMSYPSGQPANAVVSIKVTVKKHRYFDK